MIFKNCKCIRPRHPYLSGDKEADFRSTRLRSRVSGAGEAERDLLLASPFPLDTSFGGLLRGDSRASRDLFLADGGSGDADEDEDRLASRALAFLADSVSAWGF